MNILAVFAHPQRTSFTGAVLDSFARGAGEAGHAVDINDLYAERFNPLMTEAELVAQFEGRALPDDVLAQQARFERCDALALVFPVWWWSPPAMLKGWIERVFTAGWAYPRDNKDPSTTLLSDERNTLLLCCGGASPERYAAQGSNPTVETQLARTVLGHFGGDRAVVHIFHGVRTSVALSEGARARRAGYLERACEIGRAF